MDYDLLFRIGDKARHADRLTTEEQQFVTEIVPKEFVRFPKIPFPQRLQHPAGFSISGAPVRTLAWSVLVLSGRGILGKRYDSRSDFYGRVALDLAFGIMRSHFHLGYPKGTHCCAQCTLAVYPVLNTKA